MDHFVRHDFKSALLVTVDKLVLGLVTVRSIVIHLLRGWQQRPTVALEADFV